MSCAMFRTSLSATGLVLEGNLVPTGSMLVTPDLQQYPSDCVSYSSGVVVFLIYYK